MRNWVELMARRWAAAAGLALILAGARGAEAGPVYLALGDSITFGVGATDDAKDVSNGDRGYVGKYSDYLLSKTGTRPGVINLAVSGETSASFFGNGVGIDGPDASKRNTNYAGSPLPSQNALMLSTIQSQLAAGNTISDVTISLGANDLFAAVAANPNLTPADLQGILGQYATNMGTVLTEIRTLLPSTRLTVLNYYDPYAPFLGSTTRPDLAFLAGVSGVAIPALNGVIAALAASPAFHANLVNTFPIFAGQETTLTYINTGNVHPTDAGYGLIANAVANANAVPEPSSMVLVAVGLAAVPFARLRRRA